MRHDKEVEMNKLEACSRYLMYRRVSHPKSKQYIKVSSSADILSHVQKEIDQLGSKGAKIGLLLSGGMDSAILAAFLPPGSVAYTFDYGEGDEYCEYDVASKYVREGVIHKKVSIGRDEFFSAAKELTALKQEPVVPHDPAIFIGCQKAKEDGVTHLMTGVGADGRLGGFAHFYKSSNFDDFIKVLYKQFVRPGKVLKSPVDVKYLLTPYVSDGVVDVQRYLLEMGTEGTAVYDTIKASGINPVNLYTDMTYAGSFSQSEGLGKGLIKEAFLNLYPASYLTKKFLFLCLMAFGLKTIFLNTLILRSLQLNALVEKTKCRSTLLRIT